MRMRRLLPCFGLVLALASFVSDECVVKAEAGQEAISVNGDIETKARPVRPASQFETKLEPLEELKPDQQLRLMLTVIPKHECGSELEVSVITKAGLVYDGPESWKVTVGKDSVYSTELSVTIPNNDTCSIHILLRGEHCGDRIDRHFVTTTDTVEFWETDPRSLQVQPRRLYPFGPKRDSASAELLEAMERGEQPYFRTSIIDSTANEKSQLEEMHKIEKEPLTDAQLQYHTVGKELYRRLEGEREFTFVKRRSTEQILAERQNYLDSITLLPLDAEIRVCVDLRRPEQLELARQMMGSLPTPESEAYYHLTVTKEQLMGLSDQGVPILYLDLEDIVHKPHPSERSDPSEIR